MNIFITGASGLVGTHLTNNLLQNNYSVYGLNREKHSFHSDSPSWNLNIKAEEKDIHPNAVIHLAGENIAAKRWSVKQKQRIHQSRVLGTRYLVKSIISSDSKPQTFISASAMGFYGDRGQELLTENSGPGSNFSAKLTQDWESESLVLEEHGIRVIHLRFAVILSKNGGALKKMLLPFKLGLGGLLGSGKQRFSWVSIDDAIKAILFCLENSKIKGPVNISSPNPISNKVFTKSLAKQLNRPAFINMPASICRLIFGEMADELLLASQSVMPQKLIKNGFVFNHLDIQTALSRILR